jgi:hypothetical protein
MRDQEYQELKAFLSFYARHYMPIDKLPAELQPVACLKQLEKEVGAKRRKGCVRPSTTSWSNAGAWTGASLNSWTNGFAAMVS